MNVRPRRSVRPLPVVALFVAHGLLMAQDGNSLTKDFPGMSARERSRIAAQEAEEAATDQAYQERMRQAEQAFQEKRYEDALTAYEEARELRPYNVYPKVKIEDLKALLKRQAEEAPRDTMAATPVPPPPEPVPAKDTTEPSRPAVKAPERTTSRPQPEKSGPPPPQPKAAPSWSLEERTYTEGHAIVVERTVDDDGQRVVYKRVAHPWGQVFYFKDGISVGERVWKERFSE